MRKARGADWVPVVLAAWMSLFALGLVDNARGPIFPELISQFGLSDTRASLFFLASSGAGSLHNLIMHRFLSHAAPGRLVVGYTLLMGLGALGIALAPTYELALIGGAFLGMGFGGLGVAQNSAVQAVPKRIRSQAQGLLHGMYGFSSLLAPLAMASGGVQWRGTYMLLAAIPLVVSFGLLFRWSRLGHYHPDDDEADVVLAAESTSQSGWLFALLVGCLVVAEISVSSRLVLLARREWGLGFEEASAWLAWYFVAMTIARFGLGFFKLPGATGRVLLAVIGLALPVGAVGLFGLPGIADGASQRLTALCLFGFLIALGYPLAMVRVRELYGRGAQKVTTLCILVQSISGVSMNLALGWIADEVSLLRALQLVTLGVLTMGFVLMLAVERPRLNRTA
ncbi:MAG: MFS transporter [Bdellovibrionales bacterium]|nr:MFS transporter [Bdellovibrionales bacterium]